MAEQTTFEALRAWLTRLLPDGPDRVRASYDRIAASVAASVASAAPGADPSPCVRAC